MTLLDDELRALYADRAAHLPADGNLLQWLDDRGHGQARPTRARRASEILVAAAVVIAAVATVALLRHPDPGSVPAVGAHQPAQSDVVPSRIFNLRLPPGLTETGRVSQTDRQLAYLAPNGPRLNQTDFLGIVVVALYDTNAYDPTAAAAHGKPVSVNGKNGFKNGFYTTVREADPLDPLGVATTVEPAVVWEWGPNMWAVVTATRTGSMNGQPLRSMANELAVARGLNQAGRPPGFTAALSMGYVPAGQRLSQLGLSGYDAYADGYATNDVQFSAGHATSPDLRVTLRTYNTSSATGETAPANPPAPVGTTAAPQDDLTHPVIHGEVWTLVGSGTNWQLSLDTPDLTVEIKGKNTMGRDELVRVAAGLTVVDHPGDPRNWVPVSTWVR